MADKMIKSDSPPMLSSERAAEARANRQAALTAAAWSSREHQGIDVLLEVLDTLGIARDDLFSPAHPEVAHPEVAHPEVAVDEATGAREGQPLER